MYGEPEIDLQQAISFSKKLVLREPGFSTHSGCFSDCDSKAMLGLKRMANGIVECPPNEPSTVQKPPTSNPHVVRDSGMGGRAQSTMQQVFASPKLEEIENSNCLTDCKDSDGVDLEDMGCEEVSNSKTIQV
jgi:hypothetical protein